MLQVIVVAQANDGEDDVTDASVTNELSDLLIYQWKYVDSDESSD